MKKAVEILEVLKIGLNSIIDENGFSKPEFTRIFNFAENRVSLRLEVNVQDRMVPVGRVDVSEIPSRNGKITCSCLLSEIQSGNSQKVILRIRNAEERREECEKVLAFFRKILA